MLNLKLGGALHCTLSSVLSQISNGGFKRQSQPTATFRSQKLAPPGEVAPLRMKNFSKMIKNEAHFTSVLHDFSEAFVTGKFCDVKVVCKVK